MNVVAVCVSLEFENEQVASHLEDDEKKMMFYFKEAPVESIREFFNANQSALGPAKYTGIEIVERFADEKLAHKYYVDHFDECFHSWPILILDGFNGYET